VHENARNSERQAVFVGDGTPLTLFAQNIWQTSPNLNDPETLTQINNTSLITAATKHFAVVTQTGEMSLYDLPDGCVLCIVKDFQVGKFGLAIGNESDNASLAKLFMLVSRPFIIDLLFIPEEVTALITLSVLGIFMDLCKEKHKINLTQARWNWSSS